MNLSRRLLIFVSPNKTWLSPCIAASVLAFVSFPVWQKFFTNLTLPVQVEMTADNVKHVKAYWDNPALHPNAYKIIPIKSAKTPTNQASSTDWRIKVEALAEKASDAKGSEVWIVDIRTPENRINWSKALMGVQKWELIDNQYGPQGKIAAARAGQPQSLEVLVKGSNLTITLLRSSWSGKVRVTANGQARKTNLYAPNSVIEKLYFEPAENKKSELYEVKVTKTPWHRLKFVPDAADADKVKIYSIKIGNLQIQPEANGEFILPFYFWNQFSCAIAATLISFLGLTILFISIVNIQRRNPQFISWHWFDNHQPPRAIIKLKIANKQALIIPYKALKYFLISLIVLVSGLCLIEGYLYYLEKSKIIRLGSTQKYQVASMSLLATSLTQARTQSIRQLPQLSSPAWQQENDRINRNNKEKILTSSIVMNPAQGEWIWRSKGFPVSKVATKPKRILVMGDSFVWGSGYSNMNDIWWRQLQRELTRRGYEQVEVIAAGLSGASTHQELEQARNLVRVYKPNLIIWGYVTNDPDEGVIEQFNYKFVNQDPIIRLIKTLRDKGVFPRLNTLLFEARSRKIPGTKDEKRFGYEYSQWQLKLLEGKNFELYKKTVKELGHFQVSSGIPGFVMTLPSYPDRAYFTPLYSKVIPLFKAEKIAVYNILENFLKFYSRFNSNPIYATLDPVYTWRINPANGHPGTTATHFYAEQAADILEADYPEVLGERTPPAKPPAIHINDWVPYNLNLVASSTGIYTFKYPESEEYMLRLPIGKPFVQLNLEVPVAIKEIRLSGTGLKAASLDITAVDSQRKFDDGTIYSFEEKQGTSLVWNLQRQSSAKSANTIRLSASFQNNDRQLTLTLIPGAGRQP
ncbi:MAG: SGNH/GDSL hydrolase family protein [Nostoc sp.]|uniref:SGNH/GDSL hydrolase family protein n=1 Tax=Nostoc sp. TaxID=1180 RepID=UPI002FF723FD